MKHSSTIQGIILMAESPEKRRDLSMNLDHFRCLYMIRAEENVGCQSRRVSSSCHPVARALSQTVVIHWAAATVLHYASHPCAQLSVPGSWPVFTLITTPSTFLNAQHMCECNNGLLFGPYVARLGLENHRLYTWKGEGTMGKERRRKVEKVEFLIANGTQYPVSLEK